MTQTVFVCRTAGFIFILAATNACNYIHSFTRFSGELFGLLIAILFVQQGIKGKPVHAIRSNILASGSLQRFRVCGVRTS